MRYFRAFFKALALTLQGKTIETAPIRYPKLQDWLKRGTELTDAAFMTCEQNGLDEAARKKIVLHLDGRDWSMELILSSLRYHMRMEYPSLLQANVEHNIITFYALNFDDRYRITQLAETKELQENLKAAIHALAEHLQNIPPSNEIDKR